MFIITSVLTGLLTIQNKAYVQCTPATVLIQFPKEVALGHWSIINTLSLVGTAIMGFYTSDWYLHSSYQTDHKSTAACHRHVTTHCVCRIWCRVFTSCVRIFGKGRSNLFPLTVHWFEMTPYQIQVGFFEYPILGAKLGISYNV